MKNLISLFLIVCLQTLPVFGKGFEKPKSNSKADSSEQLLTIGKGTFSILSSEDTSYGLSPTNYELAYLPKDQTVVIKFEMAIYKIKLSLRPSDVETLRTYLNKYAEWNKKAIAEKVALTKTMGRFQTKASWALKSVLGDRYYNGQYEDVILTFNNRNSKNVLDFKFSYFIDLDMLLPDPKPSIVVLPLVLTAWEVDKLSKQLEPETLKASIEAAKVKAEKDKNILDEFK